DCEHLIEERLSTPPVPATERSQLQSFSYDGKSRVLEIEFRVTAPFAYHETPLPPPPRVIQYFDVPRYIFTRLARCITRPRQEPLGAGNIRTRYQCQTVRSVCRQPRIRRFSEARNIQRFESEQYVMEIGLEEHKALQLTVAAMRVLLLKVLAPRHVAG